MTNQEELILNYTVVRAAFFNRNSALRDWGHTQLLRDNRKYNQFYYSKDENKDFELDKIMTELMNYYQSFYEFALRIVKELPNEINSLDTSKGDEAFIELKKNIEKIATSNDGSSVYYKALNRMPEKVHEMVTRDIFFAIERGSMFYGIVINGRSV